MVWSTYYVCAIQDKVMSKIKLLSSRCLCSYREERAVKLVG